MKIVMVSPQPQPLRWKIFLFKIMESRVLAILLSTFLVVAFITEKAASITYLQCPPFCLKQGKYSPTENQGKDREVNKLRPLLSFIALTFPREYVIPAL